MRIIGIKEFESLVKERLSNPSEYEDRSLVLWNSHQGPDSLAFKIVKQCCIKYNNACQGDQAWFIDAGTWNKFSLLIDHANTTGAMCDVKEMYGYKKHGIVLDIGVNPNSFRTPSAEQISEWFHFIVAHECNGERLSGNWALISCAWPESYNLKEEDFPSWCDMVSLQPSVDEWAEWMSSSYPQDIDIINPVAAYIKRYGQTVDFFYWGIVVRRLESFMVHEDYESLAQIPEKEFEKELGSTLGFRVDDFPYKGLWDFIQEYK